MRTLRKLGFMLPLLIMMACKGPHKKPNEETRAAPPPEDTVSTNKDSVTTDHGLVPDKTKPGIGPIDHEVKLDDKIDKTMAAEGKKLFNNNCSSCHRIHKTTVGPGLGGVLEERSPQFVMNMILNPEGMIKHDPQVQAMKAQYETRMVNMGLTEDEARKIVEFLRNYQ